MMIERTMRGNNQFTARFVMALILAGFSLRLVIVLQPISFLSANGPLIDDGFIAMTIARSLAEGKGPSLDGVEKTNGYQPLWVSLCIPFFVVLNGEDSVQGILILSAIISTLAAVLLFRIVDRLAGNTAALLAVTIWMFHPQIIRHTLNGLETGLTMFFLLGLTALIQQGPLNSRMRSDLPRYPALLWIVCACCFVSRIDTVMLVPALYVIVVRKAKRPLFHAGMLALSLLPIFAWCSHAVATMGSFIPESGKAVRLISLCYGPRFCLLNECPVSPEHIPLTYYLSNLLFTLITFERTILSLLTPLVLPLRISREPIMSYLLFPGFITIVVCVLTILHQRRGRIGDAQNTGLTHETSDLRILFTSFSLLLITGYTCWSFGQWFFHRYYFPVFIILAVGLCLITARAMTCVGSRFSKNARRVAAVLLCLIIGGSYSSQSLDYLNPAVKPFEARAVARWISTSFSESTTIGCFQAGTIAFYCPQYRIVCLDGVVNGNARKALAARTLDHYAEEQGITVIVDWPWILETLFEQRSSSVTSESASASAWEYLHTMEGFPASFAALKKNGDDL